MEVLNITHTMSLAPNSSYDLSQVPALEPPLGVIPNFVNPYTRGPMLLALIAVAIGIMYLFVTARLYAKFYVLKRLTWEDCESSESPDIHIRHYMSSLRQ